MILHSLNSKWKLKRYIVKPEIGTDMSEFNVRFLEESEYAAWDRFVDDIEYGGIFHKSYWNKAILKSDPENKLSIAGVYKQDTLVGGTIIGWNRKLKKIKNIIQPYGTSFFGLLIKERETDYRSKSESYRFDLLNALFSFMEAN